MLVSIGFFISGDTSSTPGFYFNDSSVDIVLRCPCLGVLALLEPSMNAGNLDDVV